MVLVLTPPPQLALGPDREASSQQPAQRCYYGHQDAGKQQCNLDVHDFLLSVDLLS